MHIHQKTVAPANNSDGSVRADKTSIWKDLSFFLSGSALYAAGFAVVPIFETKIILFVAGGVQALGSVGSPSFTSLLTSYVPVYQTGKALGGICVLDGLWHPCCLAGSL
ncbi:hypothetical protein EDD11_004700 [Mortierella claussenii]|nr:hypothetical protein EDD11_004700 [Mortierella claussenii]